MTSLLSLVKRIRSSKLPSRKNVSVEDIIRAVDKLAALGKGFQIVNIAGKKMVVSVPMELNNDHEELLATCQNDSRGYVTEDVLTSSYGWGKERYVVAVMQLVKDGVLWLDEYRGKMQDN
jgi:ESCRT-II complex subunit VPS22